MLVNYIAELGENLVKNLGYQIINIFCFIQSDCNASDL